MKTLVVYYSRTGTNRKLASDLAQTLGADVEELKERASREGAEGYMMAAKDSMRKKPAELLPLKHNPADYELVVMGGPCWAMSMCTPTRTYGIDKRESLSKVAFFGTAFDSRFARKAVASMADATGLTPIATMALAQKDVEGDHSEAIARFIGEVTAA